MSCVMRRSAVFTEAAAAAKINNMRARDGAMLACLLAIIVAAGGPYQGTLRTVRACGVWFWQW